MIYLDTSAFLKLYILESGSEFVQTILSGQDDPLPVWEILEMEFTNALRLKVFWGDFTAEQVDAQLELFSERRRRGLYFYPNILRPALSGDFSRLSRLTVTIGCRTMDILHVACALQIRPTHFVSFDKRQRELAEKAGLMVSPDGV